MGRSPIGEHAMTAAERQRRYRARRAALRNAPLAMVQRAWARATAAERAEIAAWLTDGERIAARRAVRRAS